MNQSGNLTGALLQNLTVTVTHAHLSSRYPGWNRLNETPSFNRLYFIDGGEGKVILNGQAHYPRPGQLMIMPAGSTQTTETSLTIPISGIFVILMPISENGPCFIQATSCTYAMLRSRMPFERFSQR